MMMTTTTMKMIMMFLSPLYCILMYFEGHLCGRFCDFLTLIFHVAMRTKRMLHQGGDAKAGGVSSQGTAPVFGCLLLRVCLFFSPTAECFGVFSHSKGFGADRSSSKTHSPKVPRFQVKVPRFPSKGSQVKVPRVPSKGSQVKVPRFPSKGSQVKVPK